MSCVWIVIHMCRFALFIVCLNAITFLQFRHLFPVDSNCSSSFSIPSGWSYYFTVILLLTYLPALSYPLLLLPISSQATLCSFSSFALVLLITWLLLIFYSPISDCFSLLHILNVILLVTIASNQRIALAYSYFVLTRYFHFKVFLTLEGHFNILFLGWNDLFHLIPTLLHVLLV